jgi:hypothetical protein
MLDFPNAPTNGEIFGNFTWDGAKWIASSSQAFAPINSPVLTGDPQAPTASVGDNDTSLSTTAFVQAAVAPALHNVGRNYLHNAQMNIWQRGNPGFNANVYTADRWAIYATGGDTMSVSRQPFAVGGLGGSLEDFKFVLSNNFTSVAAGENVLYQFIEDATRLSGKVVTVSFWANVNVGTNKLGVCFDQRMGSGGSPSADVLGVGQSITLSNTYTRYSLTFTIPSLAGKVLGTNGDSKTQLSLWYSCGSSLADASRSGNIGQQPSGIVNITGIQVEVGTVASPLERIDPGEDLRRCMRFYEGFPLTSDYTDTVSGSYLHRGYNFSVVKRTTPTLTFSGMQYWSNGQNVAFPGAISVYRNTPVDFSIGANGLTSANGFCQGLVVASADL